MKKLITPKKLFIAAALTASVAFAFTSCKKNNSSSVTITEADAAQVTTDAVSPATGGMVSQINGSAAFFTGATVTGGTVNSVNNNHVKTNSTIGCSVEKDTTIAYASATNATPSFTYSLAWQNTLTCNAPSVFTCDFQGNGSYNSSILSSTFNSTGNFTLTGLSAANASYTFNSSYQRKGVTVSKIGNKNTFNYTLTITSTNIIFNKTSQEIASGTAKVTITVSSTSNQSWNYSGTLTFLGNKTGKLVLNSGNVYNIFWS